MDDFIFYLVIGVVISIITILEVRRVFLIGTYRITYEYGGTYLVQRYRGNFYWETVCTTTSEKSAEEHIKGLIYLEKMKNEYEQKNHPRRVPPYKFLDP